MITELPVIDQIKDGFPIVYDYALSGNIVKAVKMHEFILIMKVDEAVATVGKLTSFARTVPV